MNTYHSGKENVQLNSLKLITASKGLSPMGDLASQNACDASLRSSTRVLLIFNQNSNSLTLNAKIGFRTRSKRKSEIRITAKLSFELLTMPYQWE